MDDQPIEKQRTSQQNKALWKFFDLLSQSLNDAGKDARIVLKPTYSIPWTKEMIHDNIWLPLQKAMYGTQSTTFLHKTQQIDKIHEVIMRELGEKHGIEFIKFPVDEDKGFEKAKYGTELPRVL